MLKANAVCHLGRLPRVSNIILLSNMKNSFKSSPRLRSAFTVSSVTYDAHGIFENFVRIVRRIKMGYRGYVPIRYESLSCSVPQLLDRTVPWRQFFNFHLTDFSAFSLRAGLPLGKSTREREFVNEFLVLSVSTETIKLDSGRERERERQREILRKRKTFTL